MKLHKTPASNHFIITLWDLNLKKHNSEHFPKGIFFPTELARPSVWSSLPFSPYSRMFLVPYVLGHPAFPPRTLCSLMALPLSEIPPTPVSASWNLIHHHCKLHATNNVELLWYTLSWIPQVISDAALSSGASYFASGYYELVATPLTVL